MSFWDNLREAIQQLGCYLDILMYLNRPTFYTHSYALGAVGSRRWWWGPKIVQALGAKVCDKRSQIVHFSLCHMCERWGGLAISQAEIVYCTCSYYYMTWWLANRQGQTTALALLCTLEQKVPVPSTVFVRVRVLYEAITSSTRSDQKGSNLLGRLPASSIKWHRTVPAAGVRYSMHVL